MLAATLIETPIWIPQLLMPIGCVILLTAFLLDLSGSLARLTGRAPPIAESVSKPELEVIS